MDEQKQIEELAAIIHGVAEAHHIIWCTELAKILYKENYRKQSEGEWIKATPFSQEYCNQCGLTPKTIFGKLPPYCPKCGAKMKGGAE